MSYFSAERSEVLWPLLKGGVWQGLFWAGSPRMAFEERSDISSTKQLQAGSNVVIGN